MAGPDVGEHVGWRLEIPPARHESLSGFRVAVMPEVDWLPVDEEILAAQAELVKTLERAGARVGKAQPEGFGDLRELVHLYYALLILIITGAQPAEDRRRQAEALGARDDLFSSAAAAGLVADAAEYRSWFSRREQYRASYREFSVSGTSCCARAQSYRPLSTAT